MPVQGSVKTVTTKPALVPIQTEVMGPPKLSDEELFALKPSVQALLPPTPEPFVGPPFIASDIEPGAIPEPTIDLKQMEIDKRLPKFKVQDGLQLFDPPPQVGCSDEEHELLLRMRHPDGRQDIVYCWSKTLVDEDYARHIKKLQAQGIEVGELSLLPMRGVLKGVTGLKNSQGRYIVSAEPGEGKLFNHHELLGYSNGKGSAVNIANKDYEAVILDYKPSKNDSISDMTLAEVLKGPDCADLQKDKTVDKKTKEQQQKNNILSCLDELMAKLGYENPFAGLLGGVSNNENIAKNALGHVLGGAVESGWGEVVTQVVSSASESGLDISKDVAKGALTSFGSGKLPTFASCMDTAKSSLLPNAKKMGVEMLKKDTLADYSLNDPKFKDNLALVQEKTGVTNSDIFKQTMKDSPIQVDELGAMCKLVNNKTVLGMVGVEDPNTLKMFKEVGKVIFGTSGDNENYNTDVDKRNPNWKDEDFIPPNDWAGPDRPLDQHMGPNPRPIPNLNFGGASGFEEPQYGIV